MALMISVAVLKGSKFIRRADDRPARSLPNGFVGVVFRKAVWPVFRHRIDDFSIDLDGEKYAPDDCGFLEETDTIKCIDDVKGSESGPPPNKPDESAVLIPIKTLDACQSGLLVYTIGWYVSQKSGVSDEWSERIIRFKDRDSKAIKGCARVLRVAAKKILSIHGLDPETTGLLSALSSGDVATNPESSLHKAGKFVAQYCGIQWRPDALTKKPHRKLAHIKGPKARDNEVKEKYQCKKLEGIRHIIVMDDIVTRGATLGEIERAVQESNPSVEVIGLTLGKTNLNGDNSGILQIWDSIWNSG